MSIFSVENAVEIENMWKQSRQALLYSFFHLENYTF